MKTKQELMNLTTGREPNDMWWDEPCKCVVLHYDFEDIVVQHWIDDVICYREHIETEEDFDLYDWTYYDLE